MCEGAASHPIAVVEDPSLFEPLMDKTQRQFSSSAPAAAAPPALRSLNDSIVTLIHSGQEERIFAVLKSSSLDEINSITPVTWEQMVPVLLSWTMQKAQSHLQTMAYTVAYHIMQACPDVYRRQSRATMRLAAVCTDLARAGIDFGEIGGLSNAELKGLADFLKIQIN